MWLWWENDPDRLSPAAREAIEGSDHVGVCVISCWELAMLAERGRLAFSPPVSRWIDMALARERVATVGLSVQAAVIAAQLPRDGFPGDPADRFIYATARSTGARLVTRDERLRAFDPVLTVW